MYVPILCFALMIGAFVFPAHAENPADLAEGDDFSLEDLLGVTINTAARYEQTTREAPSSVTIITSEEIERYGYRTLEDVFRNTRGFYTRDDRNYNYVGARGFSRQDYNNRILLMLNGMSVNENINGAATIGPDLLIDMSSVERIEIVRGPGSALYGQYAMFAVVNVITKKGASAGGFRAATKVGSYGTHGGQVRFGGLFDNGVDVLLTGSRWSRDGEDLFFAEYDDAETNNGIAKGLDWERSTSLSGRLLYGDFVLQGYVVSRKKGIPTAAFETIFNDERTKTLDELAFVELSYERELGPGKTLLVNNSLKHYNYQGGYAYEAFFSEKDVAKWLTHEIDYRWDLRANHRLVAGIEWQNELRTSTLAQDEEEVYFDSDIPRDIFSLFVQDEYQIRSNLSLTLGLRFDQYQDLEDVVTPRGALVYHPFETGTLKLLYGEAFRPPNIFEASYQDFDFKGNPALKPEKIRTTELVWEQRISDQVIGTASFYRYRMEDLIDQVVDPEDELIQHQNIDEVLSTGLSLEFNARLANGLHGQVSYAFQRTENTATDAKLSNSPSHLFGAKLDRRFGRWLTAALSARYETERITVYETETDAYLLADLHLSTQPLSGALSNLRLALNVRNLFDSNYATPGGLEHLQPAIAQNGRNALLELVYSY